MLGEKFEGVFDTGNHGDFNLTRDSEVQGHAKV
jgi:hypothetical protein